MDAVEDAVIDEGTFKYILVEVKDANGCKHIVRGFANCEYHDDILKEIEPELKEKKLSYKCVGGGRIQHDSVAKKIVIYGYSVGYGKADHDCAAKILRTRFPGYTVMARHDDSY